MAAERVASGSARVLQELQQLKRVQEGELMEQKFIAVGGYGMVFSAALNGKRVAVKVMTQPCHISDGPEEEQAPDVLVDFFAMEMSIASQLSHPHLIKVLGFALLSDKWVRAAVPKVKRSILKTLRPGLYLAALQELAVMSAHDAIMRGILNPFKRQYSRAEAWSWLKQIVRALIHLHTRDICVIHRDMKAANVLLCPPADCNFRVAKICDFGMVSVIGDGGQKLRVRDIIRLTAVDYNRHNAEPQPSATPKGHRLSSPGLRRWSSRSSVAPSPFVLPDTAPPSPRPAGDADEMIRLSAASMAPQLGQPTPSQRNVPASRRGGRDSSRASAMMCDMSERRRLRKLSICVGTAGEEVALYATHALMSAQNSALQPPPLPTSLAGMVTASTHLPFEPSDSATGDLQAIGRDTAADALAEQPGDAFSASVHSAQSHGACGRDFSEAAEGTVHAGLQRAKPSSAVEERAAPSCNARPGFRDSLEDCATSDLSATDVGAGKFLGDGGGEGSASRSAPGLTSASHVAADHASSRTPHGASSRHAVSRTVGFVASGEGAADDGVDSVARKLLERFASCPGAAVSPSTARTSASVAAARDVRNSKLLPLTGHAGTLMYMAPEIYKDANYNASCDVFSFALVAWELLFMTFIAMEMADCYSTTDMVDRIVFRNWRPPLPQTWPAKLKTLLSRSWDADPLKRPTCAKILEALEEIEAEHADWIADKGCGCIY